MKVKATSLAAILTLLWLSCLSKTSEEEVLHSDSIYVLRKAELFDTSSTAPWGGIHIGYFYKYDFLKDKYCLVTQYYDNNTIRKIYGYRYSNDDIMGIDFQIDSNGKLRHLIFQVMGRESGPEIYFQSDGVFIKSYYNYGYKPNDIKLNHKLRAWQHNGGISYYSYYKYKNGIEYHYDTIGKMLNPIIYKNDIPMNHDQHRVK